MSTGGDVRAWRTDGHGRQEIPRPAHARPGAPAPWSGRSRPADDLGLSRVRATFDRLGPPVRSPREGAEVKRASAVVAPLYDRDGDTWVVLTRRTMNLRAHRGEVSFPGGAQEPGEDLRATALREAREEIGLRSDSVDLVGELDHLSTITSGSFIVPYVGLLDGEPDGLVPNPSEVDAVLHVRLADLLDPAIYHEEVWPLFGREHPVVFFELDDDILWGATAAMLRQLLGFLTGTVDRGGMGHV